MRIKCALSVVDLGGEGLGAEPLQHGERSRNATRLLLRHLQREREGKMSEDVRREKGVVMKRLHESGDSGHHIPLHLLLPQPHRCVHTRHVTNFTRSRALHLQPCRV